MGTADQSEENTECRNTVGVTAEEAELFWDFGFLRLRRVFTPEEVESLSRGFEETFRELGDTAPERIQERKNSSIHIDDGPNSSRDRYIIRGIVEGSDHLNWLLTDSRIFQAAVDILGEGTRFTGTDGSLFYCGTSWHTDYFKTQSLNNTYLKMCLYLDPVRERDGAIRFIPGTHHYEGEFSKRLKKKFSQKKQTAEASYGIGPQEIPAVPVETDPGDVVIWHFWTMHASFYGGPRRRQMSFNFWRPGPEASDS